MSPQHLLGSADLRSRVNAAQRGLISLLLEAGVGGMLDLASSLA